MKVRVREFGLSAEIPEAVQEMELKRAMDAWTARSDAAAALVMLPLAPYRIMGDSKEGTWFIEAAEVVRSEPPRDPNYRWGLPTIVVDEDGHYRHAWPRADHSKHIAVLDIDKPTAKMEWRRIGRKRRGWFTYTKARRWLLEYLEPIRDESTYFTADGHEA